MDNGQTAINSKKRTEKWTDRYRQNVCLNKNAGQVLRCPESLDEIVWKADRSPHCITMHFTVSMSHSEYNKSCYLQPIWDQRINIQNSTCKVHLSVSANLMDSPKH